MYEQTLVIKSWTDKARAAAKLALAMRASRSISNDVSTHHYVDPAKPYIANPLNIQTPLQPQAVIINPLQPNLSQRVVVPENSQNGGGLDPRSVADTMLKHYGGNVLRAMTGAHNFTFGKNTEGYPTMTFKVPRAKNGITHVTTTLHPDDTYSVKMVGVRGTKINEKDFTHGLFNHQLESHFTNKTGLSTRL